MEKFSNAENKLPEYIKMYDISGQDSITEHSFSRYQKDKQQDLIISENFVGDVKFYFEQVESANIEDKKQIIIKGLENPNLKIRKIIVELFEYIPKEDVPELIKLALKNDFVEVQAYSVSMIENAPLEDQASLAKLALENPNMDVKIAAAKVIYAEVDKDKFSFNENSYIYREKPKFNDELIAMHGEVLRTFEENFTSTDIVKRIKSVDMIQYTTEGEHFNLIKRAFMDTDKNVRLQSILNINCLSDRERVEFIKLGIEDPDSDINMESSKMIFNTFGEEKIKLVRLCLKSTNTDVKLNALDALQTNEFPKIIDEVYKLIKNGFKSEDPKVQIMSAKMIFYTGPDDAKYLIGLGLKHSNPEVNKYAILNVPCVEDKDKAVIIKSGLQNTNVEVAVAAAEMIRYASVVDKFDLMEACLNHPNIEVQKASLVSLHFLGSFSEKEKLFNIAMNKGLGDALVKSNLYNNSEINSESFSRKPFVKTGSETTLLGGELKGKTIIRHILPEAFVNWQKLYEDYNLWKESGFDYVPIEPIQSYKLGKNGLVDVYSGILDLSLVDWENKTHMFQLELEEEARKIIRTIKSQQIEHGHAHSGNFCLSFFRDANGNIDFNRVPRVYLIDFDQAVSPSQNQSRKTSS